MANNVIEFNGECNRDFTNTLESYGKEKSNFPAILTTLTKHCPKLVTFPEYPCNINPDSYEEYFPLNTNINNKEDFIKGITEAIEITKENQKEASMQKVA